MKYINNAKLGKMSVMGLGCWNFGGQWNKTSKKEAINIIRFGIDSGINFVDVAESYGIPDGQCELILGEALKDGYRSKVKIISKVGWYARRDGKLSANTFWERVLRKIVREIKPYWLTETRRPEFIRLSGHACCGRLHTDYIDLLLCHDGITNKLEPFIEGFNELKQEGMIKEYGISTDNFDNLKRFYELSDGFCAACEFDYSLLNRNAEKQIIPFCIENNIAMLTRGSLCRGLLSGKYNFNTIFTEKSRIHWNPDGACRQEYLDYIAKVEVLKKQYKNKIIDVSYQYIFSQNNPMSVVMGCTSLEQLNKNLEICNNKLTSQQIIEINSFLKNIH
ncbi:aldo/keto reductase [uncultured Bacteroides sp.]|uniref:aldo/keto reductase n=1 Tax=uncultured Bacteroides sp. TaxID=162156 RepID=UPI00261CB6CA|nr:aldo/keto reductase [uncultured Bacteroides sp.]